MKSLQEITDAWGVWYSKQHGTTCDFTASTNYASRRELNQYVKRQVAVNARAIVFDETTSPNVTAVTAYELWYDNGSTVQNEQRLKKSTTTTQSFTWAVSAEVAIGVGVSSNAGVPNVASVTKHINVTVTVSARHEETFTNEQTWEVDTMIKIPPMSSVQASMMVVEQEYNVGFTQNIHMMGDVAVWHKHRVSGHHLWFVPITRVFRDCIVHNIIDTKGYHNDDYRVMVQAKGTFTGSQGVNVNVKVNQYPLHEGLSGASRDAIINTTEIEEMIGEE